MFEVSFSKSADQDLQWFRVSEQRVIWTAIHEQLIHEPMTATRNRKELSPNPVATWALRIGDYRVFYDVSPKELSVTVQAVGYKVHNQLFIRGQKVVL